MDPVPEQQKESAAARCALQLEELGLNAWPALDQLHCNGYLLRFARGFSARANSVHALYAGDTATPEPALLQLCEGIYRSKGLPVRFRMGSHTPLLDEALAGRGYQKTGEALVMARTLNDQTATRTASEASGAPGADQAGNSFAAFPFEDEAPGLQIFMSERLDGIGADHGFARAAANSVATQTAGDHWLAAVSSIHGRPPATIASFRELTSRIITRTCYMLSTRSDSQAVACALGVLQQNWLGIYELGRHSDFRGHGYGRAALRYVENWARAHGATHAYLSCDALDRPALQVFQDAGYQELYRSWYRLLK